MSREIAKGKGADLTPKDEPKAIAQMKAIMQKPITLLPAAFQPHVCGFYLYFEDVFKDDQIALCVDLRSWLEQGYEPDDFTAAFARMKRPEFKAKWTWPNEVLGEVGRLIVQIRRDRVSERERKAAIAAPLAEGERDRVRKLIDDFLGRTSGNS